MLNQAEIKIVKKWSITQMFNYLNNVFIMYAVCMETLFYKNLCLIHKFVIKYLLISYNIFQQ